MGPRTEQQRDAERPGTPSPLVVIGLMLGLIGIGSLILQREIASTITAALVLSLIWGGLVATGFTAYARQRGMLQPVVSALVVAGLIGGASYWYFSVRDTEVDEDVVVAADTAQGADAQSALAGEGAGQGAGAGDAPPKPPARNTALATGSFVGADGHDGTGDAKVVKKAGGGRVVTFTSFDVDPGAAVEVWLTTGNSSTDPRIELGGLKGTVGDQQYEIPPNADLNRFSTVMIYCTPFTVRMAYADLNIG